MATLLFKAVYELKGDTAAHGGEKWGREAEKREGKATERSFGTSFFASSSTPSVPSFLGVDVGAAWRVSHFQRPACCLCRPGGNTGGLFPLEAEEVKAGTRKPLGTVKVQPQYISRTWEQFVCVTLKGQRWYSMIYIPERGFLNFCSFPFALRAWREEPAGVGSCSFSVPI